jgi:cytochrome c5
VKKVLLTVALAAIAMSAAAAPNMDKYGKSCGVCHAQGVAGAPKTGDADAWAPRLGKGMDALVLTVTNGMNAMPPRGMCFNCSDDEYVELIKFMAAPAE